MKIATIDLITKDHKTDEFALILVENGPWPLDEENWSHCLSRIQNRIYDTIDIAIDGHLAKKYPDAMGKNVRVQIDSPSGSPSPLINLVNNFRNLLEQDNEYSNAIKRSRFIRQFRIVLGHEMGGFQSEVPET